MGKDSKIEWTDSTWNPWMGCTRISAGCKNCYMFRDQKRYGHDPTVIRRSKTTFFAPLKWEDPLKIFVCSWSDFFHEDVPAEWRISAWSIMRNTPQHTYLLLTKRPENIKRFILSDWFRQSPHIWLGVTAENQQMANERIPLLLDSPAKVKFVSVEPMLGPIDLKHWIRHIDWIILGFESGPHRRPFNSNWAREVRDLCKETGIPFFVKQMDKVEPIPDDLMIRQFPQENV